MEDNMDFEKIAANVRSGRKATKDPTTGIFMTIGRTRRARSISVLPKDRFDEKIDAIKGALAERGMALASNSEIVIFALGVACAALEIEV